MQKNATLPSLQAKFVFLLNNPISYCTCSKTHKMNSAQTLIPPSLVKLKERVQGYECHNKASGVESTKESIQFW